MFKQFYVKLFRQSTGSNLEIPVTAISQEEVIKMVKSFYPGWSILDLAVI